MKILTDLTFYEVIRGNNLVLVDFWAEWCNPCRMLAPKLEDLSKEYKDRILFTKINVDEYKKVASELGIMSIPTMVLFKNGRESERIVGAVPADQIREVLDKIIK